MLSINALSFAPAVKDWLANSRHPRILHVFDQACNLINERREVLSIVTPQIGNGPFNLVIEGDILFSEHLHVESTISLPHTQLYLGDLAIMTADAKLWNPRPNWERLHAKKDQILPQLMSLRAPLWAKPAPHESVIALSLVNADISTAKTLTSQLAGLGQGLTPAGDDFLMGAIYATWILHSLEVADARANEVANVGAPLTTSLSGAWLRAAGKGEAGVLWHGFFDALISDNVIAIQAALESLLAIGQTSGADALTGFTTSIISFAQRGSKLCHS